MTMNMAIFVESAARMFQRRKNANDTMYIVRLPRVSEKDDHHRGNIDIASM